MDKNLYLQEMDNLVNTAINKMKYKGDFKIFTASIWTDPNVAASSISFDSEENSKKKMESSNIWFKQKYDKLVTKGKFEEAELYLPETGRNTNPADFELRDFVEVSHLSIPLNWEEDSQGECWNEHEPLLLTIGEQTFQRLQELDLHQEFELAVNAPKEWYEYIWKKE